MNPLPQRVQVIDSHTGGEPTRVVVAGGPPLPALPVAEQLAVLRSRYDAFRSAVVNEPRGSDPVVGALLCEPGDPACAAGVLFFNNVGYLGMCGHGTIGLLATLAYLGRVQPGLQVAGEAGGCDHQVRRAFDSVHAFDSSAKSFHLSHAVECHRNRDGV